MRESNIKRNEIIAIILARSGSKSIKHKNLKKLKDRPLISWAIEACRKSKMIKKIFFCTDSIRYGKIAKKYGAHEVIIRPKILSLDSTPDLKIQSKEVSKVFSPSILSLMDPQIKKIKDSILLGQKVKIPFFNLKNEVVWGATSMIISEFKNILKGVI